MHIGLRDIIKPGISSWEIEEFGRHYIESHGGVADRLVLRVTSMLPVLVSMMKFVMAFPARLILKNGDLVKVDTVVSLDGAFSDSCWSYAVGEASPEVKKN
ncbi:M24 family metallopeptidase [Paucilactobacillus hokkaidonensis]|uniref:M24 family metallopeptidase n=1 Tax=Paucilactobacillus hokkaidonensis TaxID=1193095 RepID=UPI000B265E43|nr:M24 family metallopeptidase [Paucilactobacillus hokkaidonensis]